MGGGGGGGGGEGEGGGGEEGDEGGGGGVTFSNGGQGDPGLVSASTYSKAGAGFCFSPFIGIDEMSPAESSLRKKLFFGFGSFEKRVSILLSSASIAFLFIPLDS